MRVLFLFFLVLIVLPGCAPKLDNPQAPFPDQNIVENNAFFADEGRIFFSKDKNSKFSIKLFHVFINDQEIGIIGNSGDKDEVIAADLYPGKYTIKCNVDDFDKNWTTPVPIDIEIKKGQIIHFSAEFTNETSAVAYFLGGPLVASRFACILRIKNENTGSEILDNYELILLDQRTKDKLVPNHQSNISE